MAGIALVEVDAELKAKAEAIFASAGHTVADAFRSLLEKTVEQQTPPSELFSSGEEFTCDCFSPDYVFRPNAETVEAMEAAKRGEVLRINSFKELLEDVEAEIKADNERS